uniref:KIND domain-containing protein n=1 Tax=Erpetoichthys calabaricus TaxID=27687 RepID=A0A8C4TJC7_ERPCA
MNAHRRTPTGQLLNTPRMNPTFVTLADILEVRGRPLNESDIWLLLLYTTESFLNASNKDHLNISNISPGTLLLSASGQLGFKHNSTDQEICTFVAPEILQGEGSSAQLAIEKMLVYSLGMTFYWSADYKVPQNEPIQLSDHLNCLLLSMCEDMAHRRPDLIAIQETCEAHVRSAEMSHPTSVIKQLVEEALQSKVRSK